MNTLVYVLIQMYVSQNFYDCINNETTRIIVSIPMYKHS